MQKLRRLLAAIAGVTVLVVGGAALAQVGTFTADDDTPVVADGDSSSAPFIGIPVDGTNDDTAEKHEAETKDEATTEESGDEPDGTVEGREPTDDTKDDKTKDEPESTLAIEFVDPPNGTHVEVGEVLVRGFVNQRAKVTVNGHPVEVGIEGHWSKVVGLEPGKNIVGARAQNEAGHVAEAGLVIYWDKEEPPARLGIEITSPRNGSETKSEAIRIEGRVSGPARVVVGDWLAHGNEDGKWWVVVPLRPGKNHFVATAKNQSGATASDDVTIYRITDQRELGIEIVNLENGQHVDDLELKVKGVVSAPATVMVNGRKATVLDDLTWYVWIGLEPGWNRIVATAVNDFGEAKDVREIYLVTNESVEFTANQVYGSCGEPIPYDVFHGTATPGTVINVLSDFGSGETVADETGQWEIKVEFPEAPFNKEFQVKVKASTGEYKYFTFMRTGDPEV